MWLKKPELEPLLQPDQLLVSQMATGYQQNLRREQQRRLHQRAKGTNATEVSTKQSSRGTSLFSYQGEPFVHIFKTPIIKHFHLKGDQMYNAYYKDIAVVNLYFGDSTAFGE